MAHTCRDEVLAVLTRLELRDGRQVFRLAEIVAGVKAAGTRYRDSTIRTPHRFTHVRSGPDHHAVVYNDRVRVCPIRTQT